MCLFCHMTIVDFAVRLLPHSCTSVARDGLQNRRLLCDKRGTYRVSVNYHCKLPYELSQFLYQTRCMPIALYFLTVIAKYRLLKVFISFVKILYTYINKRYLIHICQFSDGLHIKLHVHYSGVLLVVLVISNKPKLTLWNSVLFDNLFKNLLLI